MKRKLAVITISLILAITAILLIHPNAESQYSVVNYREPGGSRWVVGGSIDVVSGGEIDIESGGSFKVAGQAVTLPTAAGAILQSSLTTNQIDVVNSIWGASNSLVFEGATANAFEGSITLADVTADATWTFPDGTGTVMLSALATNAPNAANSVTGASNALVFEGATADDFELSLAPADATADATITLPDAGGTVMLSALATNAPEAANAVTGASNALVFEGTADGFETSLQAIDALEDNNIWLPEETGAVMLTNMTANVDIDDASASTNWVTSDQANWTVDVGTSNSRSAGNSLEFATDNTENDELLMDNGSVISAANGANYIGWWMRNDGGTIAADEFDVDLRTPSDTVITNCGALQIPAMAQDDWTWVEFDVSTCDLSRFQKLAIVADTGITANTAVDIDAIIAYNISNGNGPARGRLEYVPVSSGTVTRGQIVCYPAIGTETNGVETCGDEDYIPVGIATATSTTFTVIQTSGVAILEADAAISDNAVVSVQTGGTTVDDTASNTQDGVGYAMEAAADANDFIYVRLTF